MAAATAPGAIVGGGLGAAVGALVVGTRVLILSGVRVMGEKARCALPAQPSARPPGPLPRRRRRRGRRPPSPPQPAPPPTERPHSSSSRSRRSGSSMPNGSLQWVDGRHGWYLLLTDPAASTFHRTPPRPATVPLPLKCTLSLEALIAAGLAHTASIRSMLSSLDPTVRGAVVTRV
ncbi:hypothetical protein B0H15DRAFT_1006568 [Mycena belliarum]|uniref:Uncharacterized protein n=1 Tax=Mycena belliarum TaxID=1033014 RepID=A0AAD6TUL8_9AGAR|nr:hypothetical protein B0H15DRAFT_1006568 [Mycena belliae]